MQLFSHWHVFGQNIIPLEALAAVLENKKSPRDDHVPHQEIKAHLFFRLATKALQAQVLQVDETVRSSQNILYPHARHYFVHFLATS